MAWFYMWDSYSSWHYLERVYDTGNEAIFTVTVPVDSWEIRVAVFAFDVAHERREDGAMKIDKMAPDTSIALGGSAESGWYYTDVPVTLSATDVLSGVATTYYSLDSGTWTRYQGPFTVSGDGEHTVSYYSTDQAGNLEAAESQSFRIDKTAPAIVISLDGTMGDNGWYVTEVVATITVTDSLSGITMAWFYMWDSYSSWHYFDRVDGAGNEITFTVTVPVDSSEIRVAVFAFDVAHERREDGAMKIDKMAPRIESAADRPPDVGDWYVSPVIMTLLPCDDISGVAETLYSLDGANWIRYSGPFTISTQGENKVYYSSTDHAGNVQTLFEVVKIDDDITGPTITIIYTGDATDGSPGIWTVSLVDPESGIGTIIVKVDGNLVGTLAGEYAVPNSLGAHEINVTATNADLDWGPLDQDSSTAEDTVTIVDDDTSPPVVTITTAVPFDPLVPFEEVYGNWPNPTTQTFTIPNMPYSSCTMEITAHCSSRDWAGIRAIMFRLDGIGGWIGTYTIAPNEVRGNVISPGQTLTFIYDMSHVMFADSPTGYRYVSFIPVSLWDTLGFLSPGVHTLEAWVSSQEDGAPSSWVTVKLYFTGIATYENPGHWTVSAEDPESGVDSIVVEIDGVFAGSSAGDYPVPSAVGTHTISVTAYNADLDRGLLDQEWSTASSTATVTDVVAPTTTLLVGTPFVDSYITSATSLELSPDDGLGIGVDYTRYRVNDGPWLTYEGPFFLIGEDGDYTIYYFAVDLYGNTELEKSMTFTLDNSPPVTTLHVGTPVAGDCVTSNTPLDLSADDGTGVGIASIHYKVNDGQWQTRMGSFFLEGADGEYTVYYYAVDSFGNTETELSTTLILDNSPPTTTIHIGTPEHNSYVTSDTHLGLDAIDTGSDVYATYYRINYDQWILYSGEFMLVGIDGTYCVEYYSVDMLGNTEDIYEAAYELDNTAPVSHKELSGSLGNDNWYVSSVFVTMTFDDGAGTGVASVYYILDSGAVTLYTGMFEESGNGYHSIEFWSVDNLGNIELPHNTASFKIDTEDPVTTPSLEPAIPDGNNDWYVSPVELGLTPIDVTSGVLETYYRVNSGPSVLYTGSVLFYIDGTYTVEYWSIDNAGKVETESPMYFQIDQTAPETTHEILPPFSESGDTYTYVSTTTDFVLYPTDNLAGVHETEYRLDSGKWITYAGPFNVLEIGEHTVYYKSTDMAGNVESEHSFDIVVNASELVYIDEFTGNYSDPSYLAARLIDVATQLPIEGKTIFFSVGSQTASTTTNSDGIANVTVILNQPAGSYVVSAWFVEDGEYLASSDAHDFIIEKEYALVNYTGSTVIPLSADTITLRATVFDDDDGYWGDPTKIWVTFRIYTVPLDPLNPFVTYGPYAISGTEVDGVGVFIIEVPNLPENGYLIRVSFDCEANSYYQGPSSDFVNIVVYEPTGDFATGGGWIWDSSGQKANFGFNVKYKSNGLPKGQAIYVYRVGDWQFIVKSTAWIGMAIVDNHSFFEAKCVVQQYNSVTGELLWSEGNYNLRIDVWDNAEEGLGDVFQIRVYDKNGVLWHEAGFGPYGFLQGGNIVIHIDKKE
ncbi:MAG: hypothetical protein C4K47_00630 [Candidatus Thorarchaeota archaeon]|nr:MAG: hypothetical protein C4K47_00630 [Candidatus Thorarchaeota archaeon]